MGIITQARWGEGRFSCCCWNKVEWLNCWRWQELGNIVAVEANRPAADEDKKRKQAILVLLLIPCTQWSGCDSGDGRKLVAWNLCLQQSGCWSDWNSSVVRGYHEGILIIKLRIVGNWCLQHSSYWWIGENISGGSKWRGSPQKADQGDCIMISKGLQLENVSWAAVHDQMESLAVDVVVCGGSVLCWLLVNAIWSWTAWKVFVWTGLGMITSVPFPSTALNLLKIYGFGSQAFVDKTSRELN